MMRVAPKPEPPDFEEKVRRPGLRAIAELVGETPVPPRSGRPRGSVASRREEISAASYPAYWTRVLPALLAAYSHICAYTCLYIERVTGGASVDHRIPKSRAWDLVYEWSNYRLACGLMNSRKGESVDVLDPFEIADDWFALEPVSYQVIPGAGARGESRRRVEETLRRLRLNDEICRGVRQEYVEGYLEGAISLPYLERRAPFIARELRRQGKLLPGG
ncbi:MAG TPA: hypothetical protein DD490_03545 [Acidobacteria bacterium]|nr:hypothetical protein [Acidobacteriota bacterium]